MTTGTVPPIHIKTGSNPEQNLALARLAATAKQTPANPFASELAKAVSTQGKSDTHGPQVATSVNAAPRAGVYAPASLSNSMTAPQTTSASQGPGARNQKKRRSPSVVNGKKA